MIPLMMLRTAAVFLMMTALSAVCPAEQKCKGMEVHYDEALQYPNAARAAHVQGDVVIQIHIAADGTVKAEILSGPSVLAESAKRFVETWGVSWETNTPATACDPVLHVTYKLKTDHFNTKMKLPTHIVVEAPPINTNEPASAIH